MATPTAGACHDAILVLPLVTCPKSPQIDERRRKNIMGVPFLTLLMVFTVTVPPVVSQSEGDVRLADGYITATANVGRLEIYFNNRWGTFCGCLKEEP